MPRNIQTWNEVEANADWFIRVRRVYSTYCWCILQRVFMKPFLDHLNCNRDKLEWVTKQQWAVSLKRHTDNYWFFHIICLISLSEQGNSLYSPSRLICPNIFLCPTRTPPHTHTHTCREMHIHALILTSGQKSFGNFSFSTVVTTPRQPMYKFWPNTGLKTSAVRERQREACHVKEWETMQTAINRLVLTSSEQHTWWEDL